MPFIGIDLGTSYLKGAVLDPEQCRVERILRRPFPAPVSGGAARRMEIDPATIVAVTAALIAELAPPAAPCDGLVVCGQMSSLVLTDARGAARSNCIGWRDQRALEPHPDGTGSYFDRLFARITAAQRQEMGSELKAGGPAAFLFWLKERGELAPGLIPVSLGDFVAGALCGEAPSSEATNGAAFDLLNLRSMDWDRGAIEALGLERLCFPPIRRLGEIWGWMETPAGRIPCFSPIGDYQCALAGALLEEDEISLNLSTGSQVGRLTPAFTPGGYQTRPFFDGRFANVVTHLPAGRSLDVLVNLLTELCREQGVPVADPWSYIARAVEMADGTDLRVDTGFFPGPCGGNGRIENIHEHNLSVGSLFRAAFENMAQNYAAQSRRIWPEGGWRAVVFSGGLAHKLPALREIVAAHMPGGWRLSPMAEDTMLGLLAVARVCAGQSGSMRQAMREIRARLAATA